MNRSKKLIVVITATVCSLILAMVPITSPVSPVQADPGWAKTSTAVTLDNEKYVIDSWVIKDGNTYRMWYTHGKTELTIDDFRANLPVGQLEIGPILGYIADTDLDGLLTYLGSTFAVSDVEDVMDFLYGTTTVIGYATSSDGLTWTVQNSEAYTGNSSGPWSFIGTPCVIKDDSTYKMWYSHGKTDLDYTAFQGILDTLDGDATARKNAIIDLLNSFSIVIGYATWDGVADKWTEENSEVLAGSSGGIWDSVIDPCVIKNSDTDYEMWYTQSKTDLDRDDLDYYLSTLTLANFGAAHLIDILDGTTTVIGYATSDDGTIWTGQQEVTLDGNVPERASESVGNPSVVKVDSTYKMWYTNTTTDTDQTILENILAEIRGLGLPGLLESLTSGSLTEFLNDLATKDTTNIENDLDNTHTAIAYATSSDGSTWAVQNSALIEGVSDGIWGSIGAPTVIQYDSSYEMWYTKGISSFTVGNLLDILQGTSLSLGHASDIPASGGGGGIPTDGYSYMDPEDAADELVDMDADDAADALADMESDTAADIILEMDAGDAADILEEMDSSDAADIIEEMSSDEAADIIEEIAADTAADIMEEMDSSDAADIMEEMDSSDAADILEEVDTGAVADILEEMNIDDAAEVMEELSTDTLEETIPEMSEDSLTERLPGLSPDTLYSIDPEVLFDSLPNVPTEQLISENPPEPPAEATDPVVVYTTPSGARYLAIRTWSGEWAVIVGTPMPLDNLMIKTKEALNNIETIVEIFEERPQEAAARLPAGQIALAYISITFENITPEDIELAHMTFKVEKDWLEENSVHKWSVVLSRYDPEPRRWIALPTKRVEEDSSYVYYTSPITQFSIFAISGSEDVPPPNFEATNLNINPTEANRGQDITITADITNVSDKLGVYVATLWIDNTVEAGQEIYLLPNRTKAVSFTVTRAVEGSYEIRLDRLLGSFNVAGVVEAPVEAPAAFTTSDLTITPAEVDMGEEVTISALVTNTGDFSGSYEAILNIDGAAVATEEVTLAGGASERVTFTTTQDIAGTYSVTVNGLPGTLSVKWVAAKAMSWRFIAIIAGITAAIAGPLWFRRRQMLA